LTETEFTRVFPNENSIEKTTNFVHKQGKIYAAQQKTAEKTQMSSLEVQICGVQNTQFNSSRLLLLLLLLLQKDRRITTWKWVTRKLETQKMSTVLSVEKTDHQNGHSV
jgi:hypothetical protein